MSVLNSEYLSQPLFKFSALFRPFLYQESVGKDCFIVRALGDVDFRKSLADDSAIARVGGKLIQNRFLNGSVKNLFRRRSDGLKRLDDLFNWDFHRRWHTFFLRFRRR